jgi:5'-methylthioadenosine phosphorylase
MKIGIIGGSGIDKREFFTDGKVLDVVTPYGNTSSKIRIGTVDGIELAVIIRHGVGHTITPTHVNNRANIWALKSLGVTHILATTAVGSLKEEIDRGDFVIADQLIDFTRFRKNTFHEDFVSGMQHISFADPFNVHLRNYMIRAARELNIAHHSKGTIVSIEGPRFSSRAESIMFRQWGADIINMTTAPEASLAMEADIPYAVVAISTDFDCWKTDEAPVTAKDVLKIFGENVDKVMDLLRRTIGLMQD